MFKLEIIDAVNQCENRYEFVLSIAKRARQIAEDAEKKQIKLDEKVVNLALDEYAAGKLQVKMKDSHVQ